MVHIKKKRDGQQTNKQTDIEKTNALFTHDEIITYVRYATTVTVDFCLMATTG